MTKCSIMDLGLWMPMMPRFPWDPHQWHTNSTGEQPRGPWPFELILCRCMHCLEAVQGLRHTFSNFFWPIWPIWPCKLTSFWDFMSGDANHSPQFMTEHLSTKQAFNKHHHFLSGKPPASLDDQRLHPQFSQWIPGFLISFPVTMAIPWGIPIFSSNPQTLFVNFEFFIVESSDLLCGLPISAGKPRHVWRLSHLNYITHSYGLLLKAP